MMQFSRMQLLKRMEALKLANKLNFNFTMIVLLMVSLQIAFAVRVEIEQAVYVPATLIYSLASKYVDNLALTFLPILLLLNVTKEFEYGVVQRTMVSGFSRTEYYSSKLLLVTSFAFCSVFLAMFFTLLTSVFHDIPITWNYSKLIMYFPATFFMGSFALLLALLLRKSIHALAAFISWILQEHILHAIIQSPEIYRMFPFQACMHILKHNVFELREFVVMETFNALVWMGGYWRMCKMDLQ
jgi:hypothetical protein